MRPSCRIGKAANAENDGSIVSSLLRSAFKHPKSFLDEHQCDPHIAYTHLVRTALRAHLRELTTDACPSDADLSPDVKKGEWSKEEDALIVAAVREHGTKWSTIQKSLQGRSDNAIKNRYYSAIRKVQRLGRRGPSLPSVSVGGDDGDITQADSLQSSPASSSGAVVRAGSADLAAAGIGMRHGQGTAPAAQSSRLPGEDTEQPPESMLPWSAEPPIAGLAVAVAADATPLPVSMEPPLANSHVA